MRGNQFGASDEYHLVGPEHAHDEIGILQWWLAYSHSDVESFIDDVDAAISGVERDTHLRMLGDEAREDATVMPPCSRPVEQAMRTSPCGQASIWLMASFAACASSRSAT